MVRVGVVLLPPLRVIKQLVRGCNPDKLSLCILGRVPVRVVPWSGVQQCERASREER